ncbi:MAG: response regulator [Anaerolineae bacterium]|jgi:DNA-binding NtrC family response regulator
MADPTRILIVDDDPSMTKTLSDVFALEGYQSEVAHSGPEALSKIAHSCFDCMLTDIRMPGLNGVDLYRAIKARQPGLPVVLMTAYSADMLIQQGLAEGAIAALTKPLKIDQLLAFLSSVRTGRTVVIVDDDPLFCQTLGDILRRRGYAIQAISCPDGVVSEIAADARVVLLDMRLNGVDGHQVFLQIREQHPNLPVILVTGYLREMAESVEQALGASAYTCLSKPLHMEQLLEALTEAWHQRLHQVLANEPRT